MTGARIVIRVAMRRSMSVMLAPILFARRLGIERGVLPSLRADGLKARGTVWIACALVLSAQRIGENGAPKLSDRPISEMGDHVRHRVVRVMSANHHIRSLPFLDPFLEVI